MLTLDIFLSILFRFSAFCWTIKVFYQFKDYRILVLTVMFGLMTLRQGLAAYNHGFELQFDLFTNEFPGLLVSILALISIIYIEKMLVAQSKNNAQSFLDIALKHSNNTSTASLTIIGGLTVLILGIITILAIQNIENAHKSKHLPNTKILSEFQYTFFEVGNALQESYAYLLSGENAEKQEYLVWVNKTFNDINKVKISLIEDNKTTELAEEIRNLEEKIKESVIIANMLFAEYEKNGSISSSSYHSYEESIDTFTPIIETINNLISIYVGSVEDATHDSLHTSKLITSSSSILLLAVTIAFMIIAIYTLRKRQQEAANYFERELRQKNEEQLLLDSIPAMIWQKDNKNNIINLNRAAADSIGKPINEIRGKNTRIFYPEEADEYFEDDREVLRTKVPKLEIIERYQEKDKKVWIRTDKYPLFDERRQTKGVLVVAMDITRQKEAQEELEKDRKKIINIKNELIHTERINLLGQLSSSISHELNQPLSAASQFYSSIKLRLKKLNVTDETVQRYLNQGIEQIKRASLIIQRINAMAKKQLPQKVKINIATIIDEVVKILENEIKLNNIKIQANFPEQPPVCMLDKIEIQQVILNLLQNAINSLQKIPYNRQIVITVQILNTKEIKVSIRDNGIGISTDIVDKIFNAYTSSETGGVGLGLFICKTIIEAHDGKIWLDSDYTDGAKFSFILPV